MKPEAVLIAGPTASGKSAVALALAEQTGGVVINADSMQVYGDLRIITARPTVEEEARVPHRLYGHVDADADYSTGRWLDDALTTLAAARAERRLPIFIGGTGLYFRVLTQGLAAVPAIPEELRATLRNDAEGLADTTLHQRLAARDPAGAARLASADRQRVLRALEVVEATGRPLAAWQSEQGPAPLAPERCARLVLEVEREQLRARIDARFEAMMAAGALDEVAALAARRLPPERPVLKAHGVPALTRFLNGDMTREAAIADGQGDTRRYAKRQVTWFRHQMADWPRAHPEGALAHLLAALAAS